MPNFQKVYFRTWCKTCNDWELFYTPHFLGEPDGETTCKQCSKPIENITLGEIPKEKILEQRKRYKEQKSRNFREMLSVFALGGFGGAIGGGTRIVENDAGQKLIDEERVKREAEERETFRVESLKYVNLGRNEKCKCGSELKYKKCCWAKYHG